MAHRCRRHHWAARRRISNKSRFPKSASNVRWKSPPTRHLARAAVIPAATTRARTIRAQPLVQEPSCRRAYFSRTTAQLLTRSCVPACTGRFHTMNLRRSRPHPSHPRPTTVGALRPVSVGTIRYIRTRFVVDSLVTHSTASPRFVAASGFFIASVQCLTLMRVPAMRASPPQVPGVLTMYSARLGIMSEVAGIEVAIRQLYMIARSTRKGDRSICGSDPVINRLMTTAVAGESCSPLRKCPVAR